MRLARYIAFAVLVATALFVLGGCSESEEAASESDAALVADQTVQTTVRTAALKGPTAMGMVKFMADADDGLVDDGSFVFDVYASADEITPKLLQGDVDVAALPANLASVLYNNADGAVKVLAINTLGVLYVCEMGDTVHDVADLRGKTLYASGKGSTPEYVLDYILEQNGLEPGVDVQIEWKSEHAECVASLVADENGIAMLPQPFVTTAQEKNESIRVALDLNEAWNEIQERTGESSALVTGVLVARSEFVQQHPEAVASFMSNYENSVAFVNEHADEAAELIGRYDIVSAEVAKQALPACSIVCIEGSEMKEKLAGYLDVLYRANEKSVGGSLPGDDFYRDVA